MSRKRKLFLGAKPIGGPSLKSRRVARRVTSQYHNIRQLCSAIQERSDLTDVQKKKELNILKDQMAAMGGINRYQQASVISTQHFQTSKWIIQALKRLHRICCQNENEGSTSIIPRKKLKTLEVGAINDQLYKSSYLDVKPIDINAQLPCIQEIDFFNLVPAQEYDVVACSMVINFVTDPSKRMEMLGRLLEDPHFTPRLAFYVLSRDDGLYECSIRKLKSNNLGSHDSNDPLHGSWSHLIKLVLKDSKDKATKEFFRKEDMITDEFCLRFPTYW